MVLFQYLNGFISIFEWWCNRISFVDSKVTQFHRWCPFFLFELDSTVHQQLTIAQD